MKSKKRIIAGVLLIVTMVLSGCGKGSNFEVGAWNENVFENDWINMAFEIPEDWTIATDEEISEISGIGAEIISEIKGTNKEALEAVADLKTVYAFMVSEPQGRVNAQLVYENLALTLGGKKYTEKEYLDVVLETVLQQQEAGYTIQEETQVELGDKKFQCVKLSAYEGLLFQEYYCYKMDKYMISFVVTYSPEEEGLKDEFLDNIRTLEAK